MGLAMDVDDLILIALLDDLDYFIAVGECQYARLSKNQNLRRHLSE